MGKISAASCGKYFLLGVATVLVRLLDLGDSFAFGIYVGCLYCLNIWASGIIFLLSSFFGGINSFLCALSQIAVMTTVALIHTGAKRKINRFLLALYILLSQVYFILYNFEISLLFSKMVNVGVALVFSYVCIYVVRAIFGRGLRYSLGIDELLCLYIVCVVLVCALYKVDILPVSIIHILTPLAILLALFVLGKNASFVTAGVFGLGVAISSSNLSMFALFAAYAFAAYAFCTLSRFFSALALLLAQLSLVFFFNVYQSTHLLTIIPCAIGCAVFCCIPSRAIEYLIDRVGNRREQYSVAHIVNRLRLSLSNRLYQLSDIFNEIQMTFRSLACQTLSPQKAVIAIAKQVSENACADCPERTRCWRVNLRKTEENFIKIVQNGMDKGKATLLDIPGSLASVCLRLNTLLSLFNKEIFAYKQYYQSVSASANSKMLIGEQLEGVSRIMLELSDSCKEKLIFNKEKEGSIMQELTFCKCLVKEVAVWCEGEDILCCLTLLTQHSQNDAITPIVSRICGREMRIDSTEQTQNPAWTILFMRPVPVYDVVFGYACCTKQGSAMSGDTHSFLKLAQDKFLLALCDGMGSGEQARKVSSTAISLVENFYKAGFDSDIILSAVNRVLAINSDEAFTAVDICVVDLTVGNADFIKLGAPTSLVRENTQVTVVSGGSLPMGVLEQTKPSVCKKALQRGDLIVLYSDGFSDCFQSVEDMAELLCSAPSVNPQIIAEEMLNGALAMCEKQPKDDITVICAKLCITGSEK